MKLPRVLRPEAEVCVCLQTAVGSGPCSVHKAMTRGEGCAAGRKPAGRDWLLLGHIPGVCVAGGRAARLEVKGQGNSSQEPQ